MFSVSPANSELLPPPVLPIPILDAPQVSEQECSSQVDHRYGITYERHRHKAPNVSLPPNPQDSAPTPISSPATVPPDTSADQPITIRKGNRSTRNPYPVYNFVSYHRLSSCHSAFVSALSSITIPKNVQEALSHPGWRQAMIDEMTALESNSTWTLVPHPIGKSTVGCRWVYIVKVGPD
jgi:hypothetical protein